MGTTRLSLRRTGSAAVLAVVLLTGCGDDEPSTDGDANGDVGEESSDDTSDEDELGGADGSDDEDQSEENGADSDDDAADDVETIAIAIAGGEVSPPFDTHDVERGAEVRIEVTSDTADELHLHGYDLEAEVEPGEPAVLEFTADIEGRFELETHDSGLQLLQLEVG